jgi:hypothetical protein
MRDPFLDPPVEYRCSGHTLGAVVVSLAAVVGFAVSLGVERLLRKP